jgi:hypothetical protein
LNDFGSAYSIELMSFEKRLMIRPTGVVSKKCMLLCIIEVSIDFCKVRAETITMPIKKKQVAK